MSSTKLLSRRAAAESGSLLPAVQSATRTADDYATRIWADLSPRRERWALVSILFDGVYQPNHPEVKAFYIQLHRAVARNFTGG